MASLASTSVRPLTVLTESDGVPGSKFERNPDQYTVEQLKRWLKCRGLKIGGKRDELISRVSDCIKKGDHRILDVSIDQGKWFAAKVLKENEEISKNETIKVNICTTPDIPTSGWCSFQSQDIPSLFNCGHIYHYALESIRTIVVHHNQNDEEDDQGLGHMTDKPLKNGRKYVDSGFVHDLMDAKTNEFYFLRAHVWPSMKSDLPHNVLIVLSVASGAVMHASCEPCKVSALGRCSHVVAVLFTLLDHVEKNGSTISTPVTSKECVWNKGKKRDKNPQRLSDVKYPSKRKLGTIDVIDFDPRPKSRRHVEARHINNLIKDLQVTSQNTKYPSVWETQLEIRYEDYEVADIDVSQLMDRTLIIENNITRLYREIGPAE